MKPASGTRRGAVGIGKIVAAAFPFVTTVILFLILYNNSASGRLILIGLTLVNLIAFAALSTRASRMRRLAWSRPAYLWLAVILCSVLAVETAFPTFWPKEYAEIRDLTKGPTALSAGGMDQEALVFTNQDQRRNGTTESVKVWDAPKKSWHSPGREFAYYGYEPNLKTRYTNLFYWNSEGYYDHDYSRVRSKPGRRVVVIGDSYVEALQVPLSRSFHKLVEAALSNSVSSSGGEGIEVIALGNSGTGQVENLKVLKNQAMSYEPDVVVMTLSSNDFCDDDPVLNREVVLASGVITPLIRGLAGHRYFASALAVRRIDDLGRRRITIYPELLQWARADIPRVEAAWERTLNTVAASRDFCRSNGTKFILVYLGSALEVRYALDPEGTIERIKAMGRPHSSMSWDMGKSVRRVTQFCEQHDIAMISMLGPLTEAQKVTGQFVFGDHYTMFGHQVVAQVLGCALGSSLALQAGEKPCFKSCFAVESWWPLLPAGAFAAAESAAKVNLVPASSPPSRAP